MRTLSLVVLSTIGMWAFGQPTITSVEIEGGLLFDLAGSANAVEVEVVPELSRLLIVGMRGQEELLSLEVEAGDLIGAQTVSVIAGGVTGIGRCASTVFARIELRNENSKLLKRRQQLKCVEGPEAFAGMLVPGPLGNAGASVSAPLDTWLLFEAARIQPATEVVEDELAETLVFYTYLQTQDGTAEPEHPSFHSLEEAAEAFDLP